MTEGQFPLISAQEYVLGDGIYHKRDSVAENHEIGLCGRKHFRIIPVASEKQNPVSEARLKSGILNCFKVANDEVKLIIVQVFSYRKKIRPDHCPYVFIAVGNLKNF